MSRIKYIYKKNIIPIKDVLDILLSVRIEVNYMNNNISGEIKEKRKVLNEPIQNLDKKFDLFAGIGKSGHSKIKRYYKLRK